MYQHFEHTADLGLRVEAPTPEELFAEAARGLCAMMVLDLAAVRPQQTCLIELPPAETDLLLFDFLSELLVQFDSEKMLLCQFDICFSQQGLSALCRGEPMDPLRHEMDHEVKAITYHGLTVEQTAAGWQAEVIVDI